MKAGRWYHLHKNVTLGNGVVADDHAFRPGGDRQRLVQPAFKMQIRNVEDGSLAAAAGNLKKGQIIETINGQKLADIDPRIQLGNITTTDEGRSFNASVLRKTA